MGKNEKRKGDFWAHLLADILVRIGLFLGTVVFMFVNMPRRYSYNWNSDDYPEYGYVVLAAGLLAAIFGPWLYSTAVNRGRGTLSQVKRDSESQK